MIKYALRFIFYDKPKSLGVILGIIISIFLVGQQTGIFLFLTGAMSALVDNTGADIWVVDDRTTDVNSLGLIDVRSGREIEAVSGVIRAAPVVFSGGTAEFRNGKSSPVQVIGVQPPHFIGGPWNIISGNLMDLLEPGAVSADVFDRPTLNEFERGTQFEINGQRVMISVLTRGVRGFGSTYLFSTLSQARRLGNIPSTKVNAFLVNLKPDTEPEAVRDWINENIFAVRAWLKKDFSRATVRTILSTSGIALSIGTLILFAAFAGMVIIGLTMYSAAVERLQDYGTLKAIGANNRYVRNLILFQAVLFAVTGFGVAVLLIEAFRRTIAGSGIIFEYGLLIKVIFLFVTFFISLGGAAFAMRRISKLEPASVFRR
jgi:putative ABC transport system permease protein